MAVVTLSAVIHREDDLYVAECPELGTVSQGRPIEEAIANLKEATGLYLEEQAEPLIVAPAILTTFSIDTANAEAAWVAGRRVIVALERLGFVRVRSRGSHVVMARSRPGVGRVVCAVPLHNELAVGPLRGNLRQAGISADEFVGSSAPVRQEPTRQPLAATRRLRRATPSACSLGAC
jgi:predicted RNase H-like HicB family nuclease/predicted RNA binding protein YcfA (HicA-like mRNA interferase family)